MIQLNSDDFNPIDTMPFNTTCLVMLDNYRVVVATKRRLYNDEGDYLTDDLNAFDITPHSIHPHINWVGDVSPAVIDGTLMGWQEIRMHVKGVYSDPNRDPRHHNVSAAFVAVVDELTPVAADDAKNVQIHDINQLPEMAFDHATILADYKRWATTGLVRTLTQ